MVIKAEQERVRTLIADTVSLLCKNGLNYTKEFCIEGLLGITLDRDDVFLVNIKELVKMEGQQDSDSDGGGSADEASAKPPMKSRKRPHAKSKHNDTNSNADVDDTSNDTYASYAPGSVDNSNSEPQAKSTKLDVKEERTEDESDEDLVFIKDEPGADFSQYSTSDTSFSGAQTNNILGDLSQQGPLVAMPTTPGSLAGTSWDPSQAANFTPHAFNNSQQPNTPNSGGQQQVCRNSK